MCTNVSVWERQGLRSGTCRKASTWFLWKRKLESLKCSFRSMRKIHAQILIWDGIPESQWCSLTTCWLTLCHSFPYISNARMTLKCMERPILSLALASLKDAWERNEIEETDSNRGHLMKLHALSIGSICHLISYERSIPFDRGLEDCENWRHFEISNRNFVFPRIFVRNPFRAASWKIVTYLRNFQTKHSVNLILSEI